MTALRLTMPGLHCRQCGGDLGDFPPCGCVERGAQRSTLARVVTAARRMPDAREGLREFRRAIRRAVWAERCAEVCDV